MVRPQPVLDEPIHLEPYRLEWPAAFEAERARIVEALGVQLAVVQHIGSTAVAGLGGKPVVDILIGATVVPFPEAWTAFLERLGYEAMGEAGIPGRWYFRHRVPPFRNAHVVELGGPHWTSNLAFRDYLRSSPAACSRYMEAKQLAVANGATSLVAYTRAKRPTIETLLAEARSAVRGVDDKRDDLIESLQRCVADRRLSRMLGSTPRRSRTGSSSAEDAEMNVWRTTLTIGACLVVLIASTGCDDKKESPAAPTPVAPTPAPTPTPQPAPAPEPPPAPAALDSLSLSSTSVEGQSEPVATIRLTSAAPSGGAIVQLESSATDAAKVPSSVTVPAGATSATFVVDTSTVSVHVTLELRATYQGVTKVVQLTVRSPALTSSFTVTSTSQGTNNCAIVGGDGALDCTLDATASTGFIGAYVWTLKIGDNSSTFSTGNPTFTPPTSCDQLKGGSGGSKVDVTVTLQVEDRGGNKGSSVSQTVGLYTNGRCGY